MFSWFRKDPIKRLQNDYHQKLEQAMQAQRNGDIRTYSELSVEAEAILKQIEAAESER